MYLEHLPLIEEIVAFVCRKSRFSPEDAEDFQQQVHLKLIENDFRVLRECTGASLRSYLKVVILRAGQDFRNHLWGKYRDTKEALRLGEVALRLERLMGRDGLSYEEARRVLRTNGKVELSDDELDAIRVRLPPKYRRQLLPVEHLVSVPAAAPDPDEALQAKAALRKQAETLDRLAQRMAELPTEQQLLLKLHFEEGHTIAEIARARQVDQKPLYGQRDRALRWLRESLEQDGIRKEDLEEIFRLLLGPAGLDGPDEE